MESTNIGPIETTSGQNNEQDTANLTYPEPIIEQNAANPIYPEPTKETDFSNSEISNFAPTPPSAAGTYPTNSPFAEVAPVNNIGQPAIADPNTTPDLSKWSWGAFLLTWIWGIGNSVWISLLGFIPGLSLIMAIYLGVKGNDLAWRSKKWPSAEVFVATQRKWAMWGWIISGVFLLAVAAQLTLVTGLAVNSQKTKANDAKRKSDVRSLVSAVRLYQNDHSNACPSSLSSLTGDYIKTVPKDPKGTNYTLKIAGGKCIVSAELENKSDRDLSADANPSNGNTYDMSTAR